MDTTVKQRKRKQCEANEARVKHQLKIKAYFELKAKREREKYNKRLILERLKEIKYVYNKKLKANIFYTRNYQLYFRYAGNVYLVTTSDNLSVIDNIAFLICDTLSSKDDDLIKSLIL